MFIYYNANPTKAIEPDCVIRALSFALDEDYYEIINILLNNSNYFNCDMLVRDCYAIALRDLFGLPQYDGRGRTVKEIAESYIGNKTIMRIDGHVTASNYNGDIVDIWDTSDEIVDCFWVVE